MVLITLGIKIYMAVKLKKDACETAYWSLRTFVDTLIAIKLDALANPLIKSKLSVVTMTIISKVETSLIICIRPYHDFNCI